jgi:hypothetical protein
MKQGYANCMPPEFGSRFATGNPTLIGVVLFGFGFGNANSLPPLIAQVEFVKEDVSRVVPMIVAIGQGTLAFAPAAFGLIREFTPPTGGTPGAAPYLFVAASAIVGVAIGGNFDPASESVRGHSRQGRASSKPMAERVGFEPTVRFPAHTLSKRAP